MIKARVVLAGLCIVLAPQYAAALQLTNRDTTDHTLTVADTKGGEKHEFKASPAQIIGDICMKGCTITMPDGDEYEFDGNEIVAIEDGLIFLDGPYDLSEPSDSTDEGAETDEPGPAAAN
jgi:hypothetical protein